MSALINGRLLTVEEVYRRAQRKGICPQCGIKTHDKRLVKKDKPVTNEDCFQGICISCFPDIVPPKVLEEWTRLQGQHQFKNQQMPENARLQINLMAPVPAPLPGRRDSDQSTSKRAKTQKDSNKSIRRSSSRHYPKQKLPLAIAM